jgi:hypothetical protein
MDVKDLINFIQLVELRTEGSANTTCQLVHLECKLFLEKLEQHGVKRQ